jgi:hypothetical protein
VSEPDSTEQWKPDFYYLCRMYALTYDDMLLIAEQAKVPKEVVHRMFLKYPVKHSDAVAVLKAFSQLVGRAWTIDTVRVPTTSSESEDPNHE